MPFSSKDIVPFKEARTHLTSLAEEACAGHEKIITRNGKAYVALIDVQRLDYYHRLAQQNIHLQLLDEVETAMSDIEQGNLMSVAELKAIYPADNAD